MRTQVDGKDTSEIDETVNRIEIWWNTEARIWTIQWLNANGDQIGHAGYAMNKPQVIDFCENKGDWGDETVPIHLFKNGYDLVRTWN